MTQQKKFLNRAFKLGNTTLPSNILYAPLAGCSDYPFRRMSAKYKPGLIYCEMVKMDPLVRHHAGTLQMLTYDKSMHPIGAQICGSKPEYAAPSAKIIEELGFDVIDLNCGCPVDKVTKDGSGSGMLKTPHLIGEIISNMVAAVKIPVTVKIRAGWDENTINAAEITKIAEKAGAKAICIHGRTRQQAYRGPANWDYIKACKEAATDIKIIANGDLFDPHAVQRVFEYTGCDAVLIARGTMGQPWIADDVYRHLEGLEPVPRTLEDCRKGLYEHFCYVKEYHPPHKAILEMRRVGCWYINKAAGTRKFREIISKTDSIDVVEDLILNFPLSWAAPESKSENEEEQTNE